MSRSGTAAVAGAGGVEGGRPVELVGGGGVGDRPPTLTTREGELWDCDEVCGKAPAA
jgi:hypothetical protein